MRQQSRVAVQQSREWTSVKCKQSACQEIELIPVDPATQEWIKMSHVEILWRLLNCKEISGGGPKVLIKLSFQ